MTHFPYNGRPTKQTLEEYKRKKITEAGKKEELKTKMEFSGIFYSRKMKGVIFKSNLNVKDSAEPFWKE